FLLLCFLCSGRVDGDELGQRITGPHLQYDAQSLQRFADSWIHLKFVEGSDVRLSADVVDKTASFVDKNGRNLDRLNELLADAIEIKPTFDGDREQFRVYKAVGEARSGVTGPDLGLWFNVKIPGDKRALAATLNELNAMRVVEIAHPAPVCEPAAIHSPMASPFLAGMVAGFVFPGTPDFSNLQDYLYATPVGLDAPAAWAELGGRGAGVKFIDVELGWVHNHEDLDSATQFYQGVNDSNNVSYYSHGTAVLGEVVGEDNGFGVTGFASDTQWGTVGITVEEWPDVPHYFLEAAQALDPGDVWLIELQMFPSGFDATPMEFLQVNYDVIWTSSFSLDVICVEAGANGSQNLDDPAFGDLFDRSFRDSGAIMVGAGTPSGRVAEWFTNYGSRMDVHAWGSQIVTLSYGDLQGGAQTQQYTGTFGGTSGASPMVVGAVCCLQGIYRDRTGGDVLLPQEMRTLLNSTGVPHLDGNQEIGPRPDIAAAIAELEVIGEYPPASMNVLRGFFLAGGIADLTASDDSYLKHRRVPTRGYFQDRVSIEFDSSLNTDLPNALSLTVESSVNSTQLLRTIEVFNWTTGQYDVLVEGPASLNSDQSTTLNLDTEIEDYVQAVSGNVRCKVGWKHAGRNPSVPNWQACIDQIVWTTQE
ncbi:MAG: S8 family serine peptidase, partial [Planctomycetota bacterium]